MISTRSIATVLLVLTAVARGGGQASPPAPPAQATTALVVRFVDGRSQFNLASARRSSFWTPAFPKIAGWKTPDGDLPITALQLAWQLTGRDIHVDVSVLRGSPHQREDAVASVTVVPGAHVVVDALRAFGVQPVDLSMAVAAPLTPFVPSVVSITPDLEISAVDVVSAPYVGYRITVRNLTSKSIANFRFMSYRGTARALSGVPRSDGGRPAMGPGESFTFAINLTSGRIDDEPLTPRPLDVIEIQSVLFADGTIVGDATNAAARRAIASDAGRRAQLLRAIDVLNSADPVGRATPATMLQYIRAGFEALPDHDDSLLAAAQTATSETRTIVLEDLVRFERLQSGDAEDVRRWIRYTIQRYEGWVHRLAP